MVISAFVMVSTSLFANEILTTITIDSYSSTNSGSFDFQVLKDRNGRKIGEIKSCGSNLCIFDANGYKKGTYYTAQNKTYDANGRLVGSGDLLTNLL